MSTTGWNRSNQSRKMNANMFSSAIMLNKSRWELIKVCSHQRWLQCNLNKWNLTHAFIDMNKDDDQKEQGAWISSDLTIGRSLLPLSI